MAALANLFQNRLPPSFAQQDDEESLTSASKGIHEEFVQLPSQEEETIFKAVRLNDINKISILVRHGTDINTVHEGEDACLVKSPSLFRNIQMRKYSPLHIAVLHANMETIDYLCSNGANLNQTDGNNRTPVLIATAAARLDVVKYLLDREVDVNVQTSSGRTAVIEAVCLNRPHIVDMLIQAGADLELGDIKGTTPLSCAITLPQVNLGILKKLLDAKCKVNASNAKGATPLMFAVAMKKVDKIQALLKAGADVNACDSSNMTAFHLATNDGQGTYVAKMLLRHGAHPDLRDRFGKTPLENAVLVGKLQVLQMLLLADCDRDYSMFSSENLQRLCDRVPVFRNWLYEEMYNPRSLKRICRGNIRKYLSIKGLARLDELPLPTILKDFLLVKYFE